MFSSYFFLADSPTFEETFHTENFPEERETLQVNTRCENAPTIHDIVNTRSFLESNLEPRISQSSGTQTSDEQNSSSQSSYCTQELHDRNWLEVSLQSFKRKPYNKNYDTDSFASNSQGSHENYSASSSFNDSQNSRSFLDFYEDPQNADHQEVPRNDSQSFLGANLRRKKSI